MPAPNRKIDAGWVTLEFDPPLERIQDDLDEIGRDLSNMRTPLRESVQRVVIPSIDANFQLGGRPPWTPLADSTTERRIRQGTGLKILQETGKLRETATQFSRWDIGTDEAHIGNWPANVKTRAAVAEGGASRAGKFRTSEIPARPFLLIQDTDAEQIDEIFLDWMERRARGTWTRR
jgi:phage virion morphogenesis protein